VITVTSDLKMNLAFAAASLFAPEKVEESEDEEEE
jgi:hypothetical protein